MLPPPQRVAPHRLQDSEVVYIGRGLHNDVRRIQPSLWANPFRMEHKGRRRCLEEFDAYLSGSPALLSLLPALRGRLVACHCKLDEECHGDVLIQRCESLPALFDTISWPANSAVAEVLLKLVLSEFWPQQARSAVKGLGRCIGLSFGPRAAF